MKTDKPGPKDSDLRRRAERRLARDHEGRSSAGVDLEEAKRLLHELQVHHIELEMQNEELRQAQQGLEASLERYTDLYDFAPAGYFTVDGKGRIQEVNLTGAMLLGAKPRSQLIGQPLQKFLTTEGGDALHALLVRLHAHPERQSCQAALAEPGEQPRYLHIEGVALPTEKQPTTQSAPYRLAVLDITERVLTEQEFQRLNASLEDKVAQRTQALQDNLEALEREISQHQRAEGELRHSQAFNEGIIEASPDCIKVLDLEGRLAYMNPGGLRQMELSDLAPIKNQPYEQFWQQTDLEAVRQALEEARAGGRGNFQGFCPTASGKPRWWDVNVTQLRDPAGRVYSLLAVSRDITERRQAQEELLKAKEQAEAASLAKSRFLANMSHEIRTPMNAIIGMTNLTLETDLAPLQREYLEIVGNSATNLLSLLNDILDISKIEAGKVELEQRDFRLRDSLRQTIAIQTKKAEEKGLQLVFAMDDQVPDTLVGDVGRLRQVLLNLISNAIKFSDQGQIVVKVGLAEQNQREAMLRVEVADSGIGIETNQAADIFEPFCQADVSTTRRYGGTGLGLTISRQLVEMMGGKIWVDSRRGQGTTFTFTARLGLGREAVPKPAPDNSSRETHHPAQPAWTSSAQGLNILLAEDNKVNQKLAQAVLNKWGHRVTLAQDGREAVEWLAKGDFDLVLMDVEMPEMDGLTATRLIRDQEKQRGQGPRLPIIALTAHAMTGDREKFLAAGMDDYLAKPLDLADLAAKLAGLRPRDAE